MVMTPGQMSRHRGGRDGQRAQKSLEIQEVGRAQERAIEVKRDATAFAVASRLELEALVREAGCEVPQRYVCLFTLNFHFLASRSMFSWQA